MEDGVIFENGWGMYLRNSRLTWWTRSGGWRRLQGQCWQSCCHRATAAGPSSNLWMCRYQCSWSGYSAACWKNKMKYKNNYLDFFFPTSIKLGLLKQSGFGSKKIYNIFLTLKYICFYKKYNFQTIYKNNATSNFMGKI